MMMGEGRIVIFPAAAEGLLKVYSGIVTDCPSRMSRTCSARRSQSGSTTLGEIDVLAKLKEQMEAQENKGKGKAKAEPAPEVVEAPEAAVETSEAETEESSDSAEE
jgi:hypothetical protein